MATGRAGVKNDWQDTAWVQDGNRTIFIGNIALPGDPRTPHDSHYPRSVGSLEELRAAEVSGGRGDRNAQTNCICNPSESSRRSKGTPYRNLQALRSGLCGQDSSSEGSLSASRVTRAPPTHVPPDSAYKHID
eukprot:PhF_6_TR25117/c0_g1_i8/m.34542